jgi:hypothetical protein
MQFPRSVRLQDEKCNLIELNLSDGSEEIYCP